MAAWTREIDRKRESENAWHAFLKNKDAARLAQQSGRTLPTRDKRRKSEREKDMTRKTWRGAALGDHTLDSLFRRKGTESVQSRAHRALPPFAGTGAIPQEGRDNMGRLRMSRYRCVRASRWIEACAYAGVNYGNHRDVRGIWHYGRWRSRVRTLQVSEAPSRTSQ